MELTKKESKAINKMLVALKKSSDKKLNETIKQVRHQLKIIELVENKLTEEQIKRAGN